MKYSEAEKQIKALSSKYDVDMSWGYFDVAYNGKTHVAYVNGGYEYGLRVSDVNKFSKLPFSNKLYMIMAELAMTPLDEREEEKKYYIKIFDGELGYLNIDISTGKMTAGSVCETEFFKTKFTNKAIKQLKQRGDIPLDWNKVTFEEANWSGLYC
ncbi:hypothetical protein LA430_14090 [Lactiplantibacillus plantarum]|uniref:hypothetical protein n=1 Tax=Lactiplantibacillus plantarum TaxID=1590 RepID=UPI001E569324|nr:hypothetical protein [Lactiplantibacillus plantarum]MCC6117633.1 hypothetical protein [Lactiplantibacillus plantarum]MCW6115180.1 hypothetical protein [Lactiplantibacillus plantarum]